MFSFFGPNVMMTKLYFELLKIISIFIFSTHQWSLSLLLYNQKPDIACLLPPLPCFLSWTHQGIITPLSCTWIWTFWLIVCIIFTIFNIYILFFIHWKPCVMFVDQNCWMWTSDFLNMYLIKENKLGRF